jgi:phosphoribosylglycinamide formyltransferase-1
MTSRAKNIAVFVSGNGSNLQAIIDASESSSIHGNVSVVISDKENAYALERARSYNIPAYYFGKGNYENLNLRYQKIAELLENSKVDLIVLAGYLGIIPVEFVKRFENKIINVHPALLPKYGGKGYYGDYVHKAVLKNNEKDSGATVHYVDENIDSGKIILQKSVQIEKGETLETLKEKIHKIEHEIIVKAISMIIN